MRILIYADLRSPIARGWCTAVAALGHDLWALDSMAASSSPVRWSPGSEETSVAVARGVMRHRQTLSGWLPRSGLGWGQAAARLLTSPSRPWFWRRLDHRAEHIARMVLDLDPDVVHALRLPCEGFLVNRAVARLGGVSGPSRRRPRVVTSIWGNDLTLHAAGSSKVHRETTRTLGGIDGLIADCRRDIDLAREFGAPRDTPTAVVPGTGGLDEATFLAGVSARTDDALTVGRIASPVSVVINPRGIRGYVRSDIFFDAMGRLHGEGVELVAVCPGMHGNPWARRRAARADVGGRVVLLPTQDQSEMASLFRSARVSLSLSTHDGLPNTLLEAMASGCLPVVGDLASVREWITHGENGLLVDPNDPRDVASAVRRAVRDDELWLRARRVNRELACGASRLAMSPVIARFYASL